MEGQGVAQPAGENLDKTRDSPAYPSDYVDDLPLDDVPRIPAGVADEYTPAFEEPDLIGEGMPVPFEIELEGPRLSLDTDDTAPALALDPEPEPEPEPEPDTDAL